MERERLSRDNAQGPQVCRCCCCCCAVYGHQSCDRFTICIYVFDVNPLSSEHCTQEHCDPMRSLPLTTLMPIVLLCLYFTARPLTQSAGARTATRWRRWERAKDVSSTPIRSHNDGTWSARSSLKPSMHWMDDNTIKRNVNRQRTQVPRALSVLVVAGACQVLLVSSSLAL